MINTTIFKSAFILLALLYQAMSHPLDTDAGVESSKFSAEEITAIRPSVGGDHYDQRQNGTKNFRIHVDGVVIVVAPAEALLLPGELDPSILGFGQEGIDAPLKPETATTESHKPLTVEETQKPIKKKFIHSHNLRLSSLLGPILRSISP
ncbi:uncharacterized protein LOC107220719 [Neodiprion lecontei]|uniref:Uncharacterized protein LOC107220719 n=1 Tax=Neodiprion lecontei TaxID=441921 RepID=A0A6J0BJZ7_NEOLC|nr:uncharacterized protein LOC107220719 [Neodiprion lecontei]XP_046483817.1 uncharacterized protein LOC124219778 [Neodiprion pinetum]